MPSADSSPLPSSRRAEAEAIRHAVQWLDFMGLHAYANREAGNLAYGHQRRLEIARCMITRPRLLMLDEPTRGIDVGAKFEIYQLINDLAVQGKSIIMISSEMPELLGVSDRILVMSNGRVAGIVNTRETSQEEILQLAAKYL